MEIVVGIVTRIIMKTVEVVEKIHGDLTNPGNRRRIQITTTVMGGTIQEVKETMAGEAGVAEVPGAIPCLLKEESGLVTTHVILIILQEEMVNHRGNHPHLMGEVADPGDQCLRWPIYGGDSGTIPMEHLHVPLLKRMILLQPLKPLPLLHHHIIIITTMPLPRITTTTTIIIIGKVLQISHLLKTLRIRRRNKVNLSLLKRTIIFLQTKIVPHRTIHLNLNQVITTSNNHKARLKRLALVDDFHQTGFSSRRLHPKTRWPFPRQQPQCPHHLPDRQTNFLFQAKRLGTTCFVEKRTQSRKLRKACRLKCRRMTSKPDLQRKQVQCLFINRLMT